MGLSCYFDVVKKSEWKLRCHYLKERDKMWEKYSLIYGGDEFIPKHILGEIKTLARKETYYYTNCIATINGFYKKNVFYEADIIHQFLTDTIGKRKSNWGIENYISIGYNDIKKIIKCAKNVFKDDIAMYNQITDYELLEADEYWRIRDIIDLINVLESLLKDCFDKEGKIKEDYIILYNAWY